ncbi:hypothetical protein GCM10022243_52780 [Saccharothrix violaceirubra]|uniref:DNA-binding CsgD family transcriptional regulator n=1 Tax=Saccharothrix violaceirubra TaxID=413306 RepID=A0A7W7SYS6_9PSEU|nr:LuxR family transcriptional regulator [Saccharothrix violaceirubra]MBB4963340.1 DNA-binding CsgD family transcriptional regulator [Saccharothrix violaceirubra]
MGAVRGPLGRERELDRLRARVDDLVRGHGAALVVEGEPGIGKTTLVRAACAYAATLGLRVCTGAGDELDRVIPLSPLLDALGSTRSQTIAATVEHLVDRVDELCAEGPVMLVVDDLQWADDATVAVWRRLVPLVSQAPLLLVGVVRPLPRRDLIRSDVTRLTLSALDEAAVRDLVASLAGGVPDDRLAALARGAGGNPLYLVELVESLLRGGSLVVSDGVATVTGEGVPASLAAAINSRIGFLSADVRHVLVAAAVLGVRFAVADLAAVSGRSVVDLLPALQDATVAGVLDDGAVLSFRHPLVRAALYEQVPEAARCAWHAEAARALVDAGAGVDRVTRQLLAAGELPAWTAPWLLEHGGTLVAHAPEAAVDLLARVVESSCATERIRLLAHLAEARFRLGDHAGAEAVALAGLASGMSVDLHWTLAQCRSLTGRSARTLAEVDRALRADSPTPAERARLYVLAARAHWDLGDLDAAARLADLAVGDGDPERRGRGMAEAGPAGAGPWAPGVAGAVGVVGPGAVGVGSAAVAGSDGSGVDSAGTGSAVVAGSGPVGVGPSRSVVGSGVVGPVGVRSDGPVVGGLAPAGAGAGSVPVVQGGGRSATAVADPGTVAWALHVRMIVAMARGRMVEALSLADRALAVTMGDPATADLRLLLQVNRAVTLGESDRGEEAVRAAREVRRQADRAGNVVRLAQVQSALGQLLFDAGRWDEALLEVDLLPDDLKHPMVSRCDHGVAASIHLHRNEVDAAAGHLRAALPDGHVVGSLALATSVDLERKGHVRDALGVLRVGVDEVEDLLPDAARLAVELGEDPAFAVRRADELLAGSDVPHRRAAAEFCRAIADDDPEGFLRAAREYRAAGRPLFRAKALGLAAVRLAVAGDRTSARVALSKALDVYGELGAEWDAAVLLGRMREHGVRRGAHAKHRRAKHGWDSLTPMERKVTDLVVTGLSNRQIGDRLFLSGRTVATHVSHVLAKLGVRSRTDIAREAVRHTG